MPICRVISCIVWKRCLLWPLCSLDKTLIDFALFHLYSKSQTYLLLQVSLDFLLLHSSPLWWKGHLFWVLFLEGLVDLFRTVLFHLLLNQWLGHRLGLLWCWMGLSWKGSKIILSWLNYFLKFVFRCIPGGPVAKTPCFHCRGTGSVPNQNSACHVANKKRQLAFSVQINVVFIMPHQKWLLEKWFYAIVGVRIIWELFWVCPPGFSDLVLPCCMHAKSLQLCPTLWDPMDCSPPGSSVHGDSPGKNIGVVGMTFSRG